MNFGIKKKPKTTPAGRPTRAQNPPNPKIPERAPLAGFPSRRSLLSLSLISLSLSLSLSSLPYLSSLSSLLPLHACASPLPGSRPSRSPGRHPARAPSHARPARPAHPRRGPHAMDDHRGRARAVRCRLCDRAQADRARAALRNAVDARASSTDAAPCTHPIEETVVRFLC
jgi:hypothetical protein